MVSLYNVVATGCNQSFYKSQQGGNLQLQSSCNQLWSSPVASLSEKLQLDFKTLIGMYHNGVARHSIGCWVKLIDIYLHDIEQYCDSGTGLACITQTLYGGKK